MDVTVAIALAFVGWIITARHAARLSRKQHTVNTVLLAQFNASFRDHMASIGPYVAKGDCPALLGQKNAAARNAFREVLNHYEFVAVGIRNGDFDEQLIKDAERQPMMALYGACKEEIRTLRNREDRQTIYEHFQWLNERWSCGLKPWQIFVEWVRMRPLQGKRRSG